MFVVRIQHRTVVEGGQLIGPYFNDYRYKHSELNWMLRAHDETHPNPRGEGCRLPPFSYKHGFKDFEQMEQWFSDEELQMLEKHGFYPTLIRVVKLAWMGERQVIYHINDELEVVNEE